MLCLSHKEEVEYESRTLEDMKWCYFEIMSFVDDVGCQG